MPHPILMEDRPYEGLTNFPIRNTDPRKQHAKESERAVQLAHENDLRRIADEISHQQSVLVVGNKVLAPFIVKSLEESCHATWKYVTHNPGNQGPAGGPPSSGGRAIGSVAAGLVDQLAAQLASAHTSEPPQPLVLRHLDLMTWTAADQPRHELNDVVYWLAEYPDVVKLAFWAPIYPIPRIIEELFPCRISFQVFSREDLWKLVGADEARQLCASGKAFTMASQLALYQYLSGVDVIEVRRILRNLVHQRFPQHPDERGAEKVMQFIRRQTSSGALSAVVAKPEIELDQALREEIENRVLLPFRLRFATRSPDELQQADALIPRGVILYGPPGTGKTELAKWIATELRATLHIVHGPELMHWLVGGTEANIRRLFAAARRSAPSLILVDEMDALTPSRQSSQANYVASMVGQLLTEMDGLHKDEAVLVVGTTNLLDAVDPAFLRPGRFGVRIKVDYPVAEARRRILVHYDNLYRLGLTPASLDQLTALTNGPLDPERQRALENFRDAYIEKKLGREYYESAGLVLQQDVSRCFGLVQPPKFSGDHLQAIAKHLLLKKRAAESRNTIFDVNACESLQEAVRAVRQTEHGPGPVEGRGGDLAGLRFGDRF